MSSHIYIIGSAGIPARYGGFETFTEQLTKILCKQVSVTVYCSSALYSIYEKQQEYRNLKRSFIACKANGPWSLLYDLIAICRALRSSTPTDSLLLLGVGPGLFLPFMPGIRKRRLLIHVDGLEWKRSKWHTITQHALHYAFKVSCRMANHIVIDNTALKPHIPKAYREKTHLVQYGGDHLSHANAHVPIAEKYALVIARAEPENNLELILNAFHDMPVYPLYLISNATETKHGKKLLAQFSKSPTIHFIDAIYKNPELLQTYRSNCHLYIHGHTAGGTNPSLVEAMASKVPIFAADNSFNRNTTNNACLYFSSKEELIDLLQRTNSTELKKQAEQLYAIACKNYTWKRVAQDVLKLIN